MMAHTEGMLRNVGEELGSDAFAKTPFKRLEILPTLEELIGVRLPLQEPDAIARETLLKLAGEQQINSINSKQSLPKIYDKLIGHYLEPLCEEPTFLIGHPMILSPLSKASNANPFIADRFELFANGFEIANGFSEQNDPDVQLQAFQKQAIDKAAGDPEAQPLDEDFVQVLKAGLPPSGGCGLGIDRIVMLLTEKRHIRNVLAFPLIRPRQC
jgi:lysyl-tRNA synthetase class 2